MKIYELENFTKGWFIGNFEPTLFDTKNFEIAVKNYGKGDKEKKHCHKIADEYTVITEGLFRFNDNTYGKGQIVLAEPGEALEFECLENGTTVVVKIPSVKGDKYIA